VGAGQGLVRGLKCRRLWKVCAGRQSVARGAAVTHTCIHRRSVCWFRCVGVDVSDLLLCFKMKNVSFFLPSGLSSATSPLASWLCARARALPTRRRASWRRNVYVSLSLSPATITPGQYCTSTPVLVRLSPPPPIERELFIGTPSVTLALSAFTATTVL